MLVLEAFEDQISLLIFKLSDLVIWPHVIVVETLAEIVAREVLGVEHVGAQVKHRPFVNLVILVVHYGLLRVLRHEFLDDLRELALALCNCRENLFVQIAQTN